MSKYVKIIESIKDILKFHDLEIGEFFIFANSAKVEGNILRKISKTGYQSAIYLKSHSIFEVGISGRASDEVLRVNIIAEVGLNV